MKKQLLNIKDFVHINLTRGDKSDVLTDDLVNAEKRVDILKQTCQNTEKKIAACLHTSSSGNDPQPSEKRLKKMPEMHLFHCFNEYTEALGSDTVLGLTLNECCKIQGALAKELLNYESEVEKQCLASLNSFMENDLPGVTKSRKQLNKATADMDNYRTRYHTALKQMQQSSTGSGGINGTKAESLKKEWEEATTKVDQSRDALAAEMFALLSREPEFAQIYLQLFRLQTHYHRNVLDLLESSLPDLENVILNTAQKPVFGSPLEEHLRVTKREIAITIETCVGWLLNNIKEEGLFRIPGSTSKVKKLKSAFDAGILDIDEYARDPHTVAGTLKSYLRELPEPLLTYALYNDWLNAARVSEKDAKLKALWQVCNRLPKANFDNLKYLIKFLIKLSSYSDFNKMSSQNLAIAMAPSLVWAPKMNDAPFEMNMTSANLHSTIVDTLINYADWFFPGDVNFVLIPDFEENVNGDAFNNDFSTTTVIANKNSASRSGKKPAPPAPSVITTNGNRLKNEPSVAFQHSLPSSPEVQSNIVEFMQSPNSTISTAQNSVIYSVSSLDRKQLSNSRSSDKAKVNTSNHSKPIPQDRRSIVNSFSLRNKGNLDSSNVPRPPVPYKSERPLSYIERPSVPPPERPQRASNISKTKPGSSSDGSTDSAKIFDVDPVATVTKLNDDFSDSLLQNSDNLSAEKDFVDEYDNDYDEVAPDLLPKIDGSLENTGDNDLAFVDDSDLEEFKNFIKSEALLLEAAKPMEMNPTENVDAEKSGRPLKPPRSSSPANLFGDCDSRQESFVKVEPDDVQTCSPSQVFTDVLTPLNPKISEAQYSSKTIVPNSPPTSIRPPRPVPPSKPKLFENTHL